MNTVRVILDCHHAVEFGKTADEFYAPPMLGEDIYCVRCQSMRTVEDAPPEFRIRCLRCTYGKRYGVARLNAELGAGKHRRNHPDHPVRIYNGTRLIYTMGDRQQPSLFEMPHATGEPAPMLPPF